MTLIHPENPDPNAVTRLRSNAGIEILHTRDPDGDCSVEIWVDGEEVKDFYVEDIDPGRGYDDDTWEENIEDARTVNTSPAFKAAVLEAYEAWKPVQEKFSL